MKKLFIIALLLAVSVFAQQNMSGTISQPVVGSFVLGAFQHCIVQDRQMLFGPTGMAVIGYNDCFRTDFFEANGMLTNCQESYCDLVSTLNDELQLTPPHTSKENALIDDLLIQLDDSTTCLVGVYNGSMFNGTPGSIRVGAKTYFNTVKPCYVRTLAALGSLEQIYIDEPNASFLVQKLQALEVDYQQLLTMEDLKAIKIFNVTNATLTGTVTAAPVSNIAELFFKSDALFNPVAGADYWSAKWAECDQPNGQPTEECFEYRKVELGQNYINLTCDPLSTDPNYIIRYPPVPPINVSDLNMSCNHQLMNAQQLMECNCYNMVVNRIMEIDACFNQTEIPACPDPAYPGQPAAPNYTNTCKQCLAGGLYPVGGAGAAAQPDLDAFQVTLAAGGGPQALTTILSVADNYLVNSIASPALIEIAIAANANEPQPDDTTVTFTPISCDWQYLSENLQSNNVGYLTTFMFKIMPGAMGNTPGCQLQIDTSTVDAAHEAIYVRALSQAGGTNNLEQAIAVWNNGVLYQPTSITPGIGNTYAASEDVLVRQMAWDGNDLIFEFQSTDGLTTALASLTVGSDDPSGGIYSSEFPNSNVWLGPLNIGNGFYLDFVTADPTTRDTDMNGITGSSFTSPTEVIAVADIASASADATADNNILNLNQNFPNPEPEPTAVNRVSISPISAVAGLNDVWQFTITSTFDDPLRTAIAFDITTINAVGAAVAVATTGSCVVGPDPITVPLGPSQTTTNKVICPDGFDPVGDTITVTASNGANPAGSTCLIVGIIPTLINGLGITYQNSVGIDNMGGCLFGPYGPWTTWNNLVTPGNPFFPATNRIGTSNQGIGPTTITSVGGVGPSTWNFQGTTPGGIAALILWGSIGLNTPPLAVGAENPGQVTCNGVPVIMPGGTGYYFCGAKGTASATNLIVNDPAVLNPQNMYSEAVVGLYPSEAFKYNADATSGGHAGGENLWVVASSGLTSLTGQFFNIPSGSGSTAVLALAAIIVMVVFAYVLAKRKSA